MDKSSVLPAMLADRDERIAARRARRERKVGDSNKLNAGKGKVEQKKEEAQSERQMSESKQVLDVMHRQGVEEITNVAAAALEHESQRRIQHEDDTQQRQQEILEEAQISTKRNAAIAMRWETLYNFDIPQELQKALDEQRGSCDAILKSKDTLVGELQSDIRRRDDEYVKALIQFRKDVENVLQLMNNRFESFFTEKNRQLHEVENAFMMERQSQMDRIKADIETLLERRRKLENQHLEERQKRVEGHQQELEQIRVQSLEAFHAMKVEKETEIQNLEQQLEEMRATYMLNSEQLSFNHRVLRQREQDVKTMQQQQKKKILRLQEVLSGLIAKYQKTDKEYRQQNMELTSEYQRTTEQYKDQQLKMKHFEEQDRRKFDEVWQLNEDQARDIVHKLLEADHIIHEQQLDLVWVPPQEDVFSVEKRAAMDFLRDVESSADVTAGAAPASEEGHSHGVAGVGAGAAGAAPSDTVTRVPSMSGDEMSAAGSRPSVTMQTQKTSKQIVRRVMDLLVSEASFLLEERVRVAVDEAPADQKNIIQMDAVLKALGIETEEHIEKLLDYFVRDRETGELITAAEASGAVRRFVEDHKQILSTKPRTAATHKSRNTNRSTAGKQEYETMYQIDEFWTRVSHALPDRTLTMWTALSESLEKYNKLLYDRQNLLGDTMRLRAQNEQLKALLNQYLGSKVNDELYVPPTQLVSMQKLSSEPAPGPAPGGRSLRS